jgi:hypothetical protein
LLSVALKKFTLAAQVVAALSSSSRATTLIVASLIEIFRCGCQVFLLMMYLENDSSPANMVNTKHNFDAIDMPCRVAWQLN